MPGRTWGSECITEAIGMTSSHHPRPWSLRPEDLLIESARDRLMAQAAVADAMDQHVHAETPRPYPLASLPMRPWLSVTISKLGRLVVAPWRWLKVAAATIPDPS